MAVFRIEKTRDYTVMANHHLRNRDLTLKAKGLMSVMLSLPDDWDYTLKGLAHISREGVDAIREAVRELERAGYIVRSRVRNEKGQLTVMEYVIYEQPKKPEAVTETPASDSPVLEKPILENPTLDNPTQDNPALDLPTLDNPTQLNTKTTSTQKEKIEKSIPHGVNPYQSNPYPSTPAREQRPSLMEQVRAIVHRNIDYDVMCQQFEQSRLDEIVSLMVEVLCSKALFFAISGEEYPAELVHDRLLKINSLHIQYVFECLNKTCTRVGNIKAYLLTTLFNAAATMSNYYDARLRHEQNY